MTTERPRPIPAHATRASTLKLYFIALLASAYVGAGWLFGARVPATPAELSVTEPARVASGQPQMATWIDDLPRAQRPAVAVPVG